MRAITNVVAAALAMIVLIVPARACNGPVAEFRKLADDVYAYVGKNNDANALVVVTSQGTVLVDTGNNQPETRNIKRHIEAVSPLPVRWVIITQNHGDHIGGAPLFSPPAALIVHDRVLKDLGGLKPFQINSWRKRFPERTAALANVSPSQATMSFPSRLSLNLGGKLIELINVEDRYNVGDIGVWLPQSGVLHAGFAGYKDRHPDIRPDYSHGTTEGFLKQLETFIALKPKVVVPAHGPVGDAKDLGAMLDYMLLARQKVRGMMDKGLSLEAIVKAFHMNEFVGWDRTSHFPWMAETIHRELMGQGPQQLEISTRRITGTIAELTEEGRYLMIAASDGARLKLRVTSDTDIEGIPDRSHFKVGARIAATYQVPEGGKAALGYDVEEMTVQP